MAQANESKSEGKSRAASLEDALAKEKAAAQEPRDEGDQTVQGGGGGSGGGNGGNGGGNGGNNDPTPEDILEELAQACANNQSMALKYKNMADACKADHDQVKKDIDQLKKVVEAYQKGYKKITCDRNDLQRYKDLELGRIKEEAADIEDTIKELIAEAQQKLADLMKNESDTRKVVDNIAEPAWETAKSDYDISRKAFDDLMKRQQYLDAQLKILADWRTEIETARAAKKFGVSYYIMLNELVVRLEEVIEEIFTPEKLKIELDNAFVSMNENQDKLRDALEALTDAKREHEIALAKLKKYQDNYRDTMLTKLSEL